MRLHRLEVTAFGPFSGSESVDFDALTDAGLFLLCGPTGAGKTSVLDAVCFGLYGEVPGDRNSAKRLRSDHAEPGVSPSVTLEASINGRRFRIRRSPAWQRPKRRGTGTTTEHAKVNLEELVDGTWVHHSNRLDETGHLITELLGMNVSQFTQVAMLPQGRFQSFLRAKSDERHKVLQRLFRTGRFEDIEKWLVHHRQSLKAANRGHQEAVASVVSRLSEAADTEVPGEWELHELAVPAEAGAVAGWSAALLAAVDGDRHVIATEHTSVADAARRTRDRLAEGRSLVELRGKHDDALRIEQSLDESADEADRASGRVEAARRAAAVAPLVKVAMDATTNAERAQRDLGRLLAEAAHRLGSAAEQVTTADLATAERQAHEAATVAKALLPREAELKHAQATVDDAEQRLGDLTEESARLEVRCSALPTEIHGLRESLAEQTSLAAEVTTVVKLEAQLVEQLHAAEQAAVLRSELKSARELLQASVDQAQTLREGMHEVREARINGMAAELAAALASGGCCPVCGSAEHPSMAQPLEGAPTKGDEDAARTAYENADFARQAHAEAVTTLEQNLALAVHSAGGKTSDTLDAELRAVRGRHADCVAAAAERDRLQTAIALLETELGEVQHRSTAVQTDLARLTQARDHAREVVEKVTGELSALFEDEEVADSVARLIELKSAAGTVFARAREALGARDAATARAEEARKHAADCADEHGFGSIEAATAASLSTAGLSELEELLRSREQLRATAQGILGDEAVRAAAAAEAPDVDALQVAVDTAEGELATVGARLRVLESRAARLRSLQAELVRELDAWAPTRAAYSVAHTVSTFVEGKGGDNTLQMRLSAYVLAARLKQVVAAANERLRRMSDERYTLEHSAARGVGELRGGLSLLVRDEWTGESRDPATLSGGETFVASLALALGLADVVTQEAGGSNIDTLFIDEGFGTLDPETLDDVMNTLDGLRDGGRVVGIVSHVPEMRTRITSQLQIRKDRTGSRILTTREAV